MEFYDRIAESWYNVRHRTIFRRELSGLSESWEGGSLLNLGCAHGADFIPFSPEKFIFFGADSSKELVLLSRKYAKKNCLAFRVCAADFRVLPYKSKSFDYVICAAALHHLLTREDRVKALKEIGRVLRKEAFIAVWDRENHDLPDSEFLDRGWSHRGRKLSRRYYLYNIGGLRRDLGEAGLEIIEIKSDGRNILAMVKLK